MASKPLNTLTDEECSQYFEVLQKNADEQWSIADSLSNVGQYGAATSHLLISVEESIKSTIIYLDMQGYNFRKVKGIDAIFNNHKIRFFIAYFMFAVVIFGDDVIKLLAKIKKNPKLINEYMALFKTRDEIPTVVKYYFLRKFILLKREQEFFKKADLTRQIGFYVDYNEGINSPQKMSAQDYNQIYERMVKVKRFVKGLIGAFIPSDENMKDIIDKNKEMFNDEKYYKYIEIGLGKAKKTKSSPFDLLKDI